MEPMGADDASVRAIQLLSELRPSKISGIERETKESNNKIHSLNLLKLEVKSCADKIASLDDKNFTIKSIIANSGMSRHDLEDIAKQSLEKINKLINDEEILIKSKNDKDESLSVKNLSMKALDPLEQPISQLVAVRQSDPLAPSLWTNENTSNRNAIVENLKFLNSNPAWVDNNPKDALKRISLLKKTDMILNQILQDDLKIYAELLSKYPNLFSPQSSNVQKITIETTNPSKKVEIPKNNLVSLSNKFYAMLANPLQEKNKQKIKLNTDEYDEQGVISLLNYLQSGEVEPIGENVMNLLYLADEHGFLSLKEKCISFISMGHIHPDHTLDILQAAIDTHTPKLLWYLMHSEIPTTLDFEFLPGKEKELLKELMLLKQTMSATKNLGEFTFRSDLHSMPVNCLHGVLSEYIPVSIILERGDNRSEIDKFLLMDLTKNKSITSLICDTRFISIEFLKERVLKNIKELKEFGNRGAFLNSIAELEKYIEELSPVNISVLNLTNCNGITDQDLDKLNKKFPNLRELYIGDNQNIKAIPFKNLKVLCCRGCTSLQEVSVGNAEKVEFELCNSLKNLQAVNIEKVVITSCHGLEKLLLDTVNEIKILKCNSLKNVQVSNAEGIAIENCDMLEEVSINYSKIGYIYQCMQLKKATLNNMEKVELHFCPPMKNFSANNVKKVIVNRCFFLEEFSAIGAENVVVDYCPVLKNIATNAIVELRSICPLLKLSTIEIK